MGASGRVRTVYVHEWTAGGNYVGDVQKVIAAAKHAAEQLGVDTSYDDWATVTVDGDTLVSFTSSERNLPDAAGSSASGTPRTEEGSG